MNRMYSTLSAVALASSWLAGCAEVRGASMDAAEAGAASRQFQKTEWRIAWTVDGSPRSAPIRRPARLAADGQRVYAIDLSGGVIAYKRHTGERDWSTVGPDTARGARMTRPRDVVTTRKGQIIVADADLRALLVFDTTGAHVRTIPIFPPVWSLCALGDSLLMLTLSTSQPVWLLDLGSGAVARSELPWPDVKDAPPNQWTGTFQSNERGDACVFTRETGDGFAVWRNGAFGPPHPFVESLGAAPRRRGTFTAMSGSMIGEEIFIVFGGTTADRRRIIDVYDAMSGRYKRTIEAPAQMLWMTHQGGRFFGIVPEDGARDIIAFEPARPE